MPPEPVSDNELFGFGGVSQSNNALPASSKYSTRLEEFACICALPFYKAKSSSPLQTAAECDSEQTKTWLCSIGIINAWLKFHSARTYWHLG